MIVPAQAGLIPPRPGTTSGDVHHPRTRGADPSTADRLPSATESCPRRRGWSRVHGPRSRLGLVVPHAGGAGPVTGEPCGQPYVSSPGRQGWSLAGDNLHGRGLMSPAQAGADNKSNTRRKRRQLSSPSRRRWSHHLTDRLRVHPVFLARRGRSRHILSSDPVSPSSPRETGSLLPVGRYAGVVAPCRRGCSPMRVVTELAVRASPRRRGWFRAVLLERHGDGGRPRASGAGPVRTSDRSLGIAVVPAQAG